MGIFKFERYDIFRTRPSLHVTLQSRKADLEPSNLSSTSVDRGSPLGPIVHQGVHGRIFALPGDEYLSKAGKLLKRYLYAYI